MTPPYLICTQIFRKRSLDWYCTNLTTLKICNVCGNEQKRSDCLMSCTYVSVTNNAVLQKISDGRKLITFHRADLHSNENHHFIRPFGIQVYSSEATAHASLLQCCFRWWWVMVHLIIVSSVWKILSVHALICTVIRMYMCNTSSYGSQYP